MAIKAAVDYLQGSTFTPGQKKIENYRITVAETKDAYLVLLDAGYAPARSGTAVVLGEFVFKHGVVMTVHVEKGTYKPLHATPHATKEVERLRAGIEGPRK